MESLGYEQIGTGPQHVIVLNDWMADTSTWSDARPYLDCQRFSWVFADLAGYGRSLNHPGPFTLQRAAADVLELAGKIGWSEFAVVGHSMSSLIALHLAQTCPGHVRRVAVIAPAPPTGFGADNAMLAELRGLAFATDQERFTDLQARWGNRLSSGWIKFKVESWRRTSSPEAVADYARMFACDGLPDPTAPIQIPLLALTGEEDYEVMRREVVARQLAPLATDLSVVSFSACSHYPMQEMPPLTVAVIEKFLGP